jgi:hypothetical protein
MKQKKPRKPRKKKNLSEEELQELKKIQETKEDTKNDILFRTTEEDEKKKKERDRKKEDEIISLTGGGQISYKNLKSFNTVLLLSAIFRNITFREEFYDHLWRMTGLERDKNNPHYRPNIFAVYTIKYIYRRFNIKNLMDELRVRNPFITAESMREFKHYQFFNEENYLKLLGFIDEFVQYCNDHPTALYQFDVDYCKKHNLTTDGDMFYNN